MPLRQDLQNPEFELYQLHHHHFIFIQSYILQLDWPTDSYASLGGPLSQFLVLAYVGSVLKKGSA